MTFSITSVTTKPFDVRSRTFGRQCISLGFYFFVRPLGKERFSFSVETSNAFSFFSIGVGCGWCGGVGRLEGR